MHLCYGELKLLLTGPVGEYRVFGARATMVKAVLALSASLL